MLSLDEYQAKARLTAVYHAKAKEQGIPSHFYPVFKLMGEAGEVSEKFGKLIRDRGGVIDGAFVNDMKKELGDVLWYIANIAMDLGLSLNEVGEGNLAKLADRKERGVIGGSGDNR